MQVVPQQSEAGNSNSQRANSKSPINKREILNIVEFVNQDFLDGIIESVLDSCSIPLVYFQHLRRFLLLKQLQLNAKSAIQTYLKNVKLLEKNIYLFALTGHSDFDK